MLLLKSQEMKSLYTSITLFCLTILFSCSGPGKYYKPIEITPEAILTPDSLNTTVIFSVPLETEFYPAGAELKDKGEILKVYLVKAPLNADSVKVDIPARLVKENAELLSKGYRPASYFVTLPTEGRGFRFCNQGGCGDLITSDQTLGDVK